ncbi:MAG: hypothetical protein Q7S92_03380, partial [Candidatus Diapherotrites archaeon]|nr:hypothetical protein [Candidatus Diapherotrites archaeon]
IASEKEYEIITTNPEELKAREKLKELQKKPVEKSCDLFKRAYWKKNELSLEEADILQTAGWSEVRDAGFGEGQGNAYMVCNELANEGRNHFLLTELIYDEIQKYTGEVQRYGSTNPDIIFKVGEKRIAFEIETGDFPNASNEKKSAKLEQLRKLSKDWYFVVTHSHLKKEYLQYGKTLTRTEVVSKIKELFGLPK